MNLIPVDPKIWKLAGEILTVPQLTALELRELHGYSWNMIAIAMNKTRSTVKEHHRAATKKLVDAIEAAGGDIDLALAVANRDKNIEEQIPSLTAAAAAGWPEPRAASEETPEEKTELDRIWKETA